MGEYERKVDLPILTMRSDQHRELTTACTYMMSQCPSFTTLQSFYNYVQGRVK